MQTRLRIIGLALAACALTPMAAIAQGAFPSRTITMIVPYTPGGATDIIGRIVAQGLERELGQSVVVENVPGAGGSLGAVQAAQATPDGHTLLLGALTSHSINMSLVPPPGFDLLEDFEPVGLAGSVALALITRPGLEASNVEELLELVRANPGGLTYASSGAGSPQHLGMEMMKAAAGIDVVHVPYQGSSPALTDIRGGHVDFMLDTVPSILPALDGDSVQLLGVATLEPSPFLPEGTPTVASAGLDGFEVQSWFGVLAPSGTPEEITARLNEAVNAVLQSEEAVAALQDQGVVPAPGTPADETALMESEIGKWRQVIETAGPLE